MHETIHDGTRDVSARWLDHEVNGAGDRCETQQHRGQGGRLSGEKHDGQGEARSSLLRGCKQTHNRNPNYSMNELNLTLQD